MEWNRTGLDWKWEWNRIEVKMKMGMDWNSIPNENGMESDCGL